MNVFKWILKTIFWILIIFIGTIVVLFVASIISGEWRGFLAVLLLGLTL